MQPKQPITVIILIIIIITIIIIFRFVVCLSVSDPANERYVDTYSHIYIYIHTFRTWSKCVEFC